MKIAIAALPLIMLPSAWAQFPPMSAAPDFSALYERVSRSNFVVMGRVVSGKPVSKRSVRKIQPIQGPSGQTLWPGPPVVDMLAGMLYTIDVETPLCRQQDFAPVAPTAPPVGKQVQVFLPLYRTSVTSDVDPRNKTAPEFLLDGKRYLLFLLEYAGQEKEKTTAEYELDPAGTYYRGFDGYRGTVPLPEPGQPDSMWQSVTPVLNAVTALCQAVAPPGLRAKIDALKRLRQSADPRWQNSVDAAIRELQVAQPGRLP